MKNDTDIQVNNVPTVQENQYTKSTLVLSHKYQVKDKGPLHTQINSKILQTYVLKDQSKCDITSNNENFSKSQIFQNSF